MQKIIFAITAILIFSNLPLFSQCDNEDFETGDLTGWKAYTGNIDGAGNVTINNPGAVTGRHTIMEFGTMDPVAEQCGIDLPTVDPSGYYSLRLGNIETGARAESVRKEFTVEKDKAFFLYKYAIVLEDPGHHEYEQPRFNVKVYDEKGDLVPCGEFNVIAGPTAKNKGFKECNTTGQKFWVKEWTIAGADLSNYIGKKITIEFSTTDCSRGGHAGYAYIEASCKQVGIRIEGFCPPNSPPITATVTEGFSDYLWSNGKTGTSAVYNNPQPGDTISVKVTSVTGCDTTIMTVLKDTAPTPVLDPFADTIICQGAPFLIKASGINVGYFYWPQSNTYGENYFLTVDKDTAISVFAYDSNGCHHDADTLFITTRNFNVKALKTDNACPQDTNGSISLTPSGGIGTYVYSWSNDSTTPSISLLRSGEYTYTVTDDNGNGCSKDSTIEIVSQKTFELKGTAEETRCDKATGKAIVEVTGSTAPLLYDWGMIGNPNNNNDTLYDVPAGFYTVNVKEDIPDGCWDTMEIEVTEPVFHVHEDIDHPYCKQGTGRVEILPHGGTPPFSITFGTLPPTNNTEFTNLNSGRYKVKIEDDDGCYDSIEVFLYKPNAPIKITFDTSNVKCKPNDGSIEARVSGGMPIYYYSWSNFETTRTITDLSAGLYELEVTDDVGCKKDTSITLSTPGTFLTVDNIVPVNNTCPQDANGSVKVTVINGAKPYSYLWSNGKTTDSIGGLTNGEYTLRITDNKTCMIDTTIEIDDNNPMVLTSDSVPSECSTPTGKAIVHASGTPGITFSYKWDQAANPTNNSHTLSNVPAGIYFVEVTENKIDGCWDTLRVEVTQPEVDVNIADTIDPRCVENTGKITIATVNAQSPYTVTLGSISSSDTIFENLSSGNYLIKVVDRIGCSDTVSVSLKAPPPPIEIVFDKSDPVCSLNDGSITAAVSGGVPGYSLLWNTSDTTAKIDSVSEGNYTLSVTDTTGCQEDSTVFVNGPGELLSLDFENVDASCDVEDGKSTAVPEGGTQPYDFVWGRNGETTQGIDSLARGYYLVTVTDSNRCQLSDSTYIDSPENTVLIDYTAEDASYGKNNGAVYLMISEGESPYRASWPSLDISDALSVENIPSGEYYVVVTDGQGCLTDTIVVVEEAPPITPTNAFTPNGDGKNENWLIREIENYPNALVSVYTRWGNMVYQTKNYASNPWLGIHEGKILPVDTYYYVIEMNIEGVKAIVGYVDLIK